MATPGAAPGVLPFAAAAFPPNIGSVIGFALRGTSFAMGIQNRQPKEKRCMSSFCQPHRVGLT